MQEASELNKIKKTPPQAAASDATTLKPQFVVGVLVALTVLMIALLKLLVRYHG